VPILGLLVRTAAGPGARERVIEVLAADARIEVGTPEGASLPVVLETSAPYEEEAVIDGLLRAAPVLGVDVVFASFEDLDGEPAPTSARGRRSRAERLEEETRGRRA
jgi:hypothetical protein